MNIWLRNLAVASLLGLPIAILGWRLDLLSLNAVMLVVLVSLLIALLVFVIGTFLGFKQKGNNSKGSKNAGITILISAIPMFAIGSLFISARDVPRIHNISTDVTDPPAFIKLKQGRSSEYNSLDYDSDKLADIQRQAYPDVKTLMIDMTLAQAHDRALAVIDQLGWDLVSDNQTQNIIEASQTSLLWGFTDDIVIRIRSDQNDDQVMIDLRSVSRVGLSDLGANAKRIEKFLQTF